MIFDVRNALTQLNCALALEYSTTLFESKYSNNEIRMLYASAQGCNVGIQLYPLIDEISVADFSTVDAIFKSLVRLFPSRTALDSKLQSTGYIQDALQAILIPGTVIGASDQNVINAFNTGSVLYRDRTDDSNAFLVFTAMAGVGTSLNRYGYSTSDDPASLGYTQAVALPWLTRIDVKLDSTHNGCALASSLLNMFDAMSAVSGIASGSISTAFSAILAVQGVMEAAAKVQCQGDGFTGDQCDVAKARLRYRDACFEQDSAASFAGALNRQIDTGWL
jgi:hypothetical protein